MGILNSISKLIRKKKNVPAFKSAKEVELAEVKVQAVWNF